MKKQSTLPRWIRRALGLALLLPLIAASPASGDHPLAAEVVQANLPIEVELSGTFAADDKDEVRMEPKEYRGDLIITSLVPEGRSVKKGDVLIEFDRSKIDDAIEEARSEVRDEEVELEKAKADLASWEIDDARAKAKAATEVENAEAAVEKAREEAALELIDQERSVESAEEDLADAKVDLEQLLQLYEERELHTATENALILRERRGVRDAERRLERARQDFEIWKKYDQDEGVEEKQTELDDKLAEVESAEVQRSAERKEKEAAVAKAERTLRLAETKVSELQEDLESLVVTSPRDGVTFYGSLGEGDGFGDVVMIGIGGSNDEMKVGGRVRTFQVLMTVASMERLSVHMKAREGDIQHLAPGLPITIRPDAYPALAITGTLERVDAVASRTGFMSEVREFTVTGTYAGEHPQLRSGMNCRVTVQAGSVEDCVQIPILAVFSEGDEFFALVLDKSGEQVRRGIEIGQANDTMVEITSGLRAGERVALYDPSAR